MDFKFDQLIQPVVFDKTRIRYLILYHECLMTKNLRTNRYIRKDVCNISLQILIDMEVLLAV